MRRPLVPVLIVVAALLALSLDHGLPHRYVPDDSAVKCALGIARDVGEGRVGRLAALVPPAGHYTTYPYLLPYLDLAAVGVRYGLGHLAGHWSGSGAFGQAVFEDATLAWLPARVVTMLLTLLLPLATYAAARQLSRTSREAALAALLAGSSLLVVQFAHTARPWAPLTGLWAATLASCLRLQNHRRLGDTALAWGCAALAAATHPVGLLCLGLPALASWRWRPRAGALLGGLVTGALVVALVGYPYLLVYGPKAGVGAGVDPSAGAVGIGGQVFDLTRFTAARLVPTIQAWLGYEPVLVLAGLAGWVLWWRRGLPAGARLVLVPPAGITLLFLLYDGTHVRYLMPVIPTLALGAAHALSAAVTRARPVATGAAVVALALPLVQAARLDVVLGREDTRTQAARELVGLIAPQEVVAVDHFGSAYGPPLIPTAESVARIEPLVGLSRTEQRVLERRAAGRSDPAEARPIVPLTRFWLYDSYYPSDYLLREEPTGLDAFLREWEVDVFVQVDRQPDEQRRQPVTDLTRARGDLFWSCSPAGNGEPPHEAALPTAMAFPLVDLWRVQRPGPWIRAWRLRADSQR